MTGSPRPHVVLSVAMSVDGCIDDTSDTRLVLSNAADLDEVDELRAGCDAILVGAGTVRADDPRLVLRSAARRAARVARGEPGDPAKVTLTGGGGLAPTARFFTVGEAAKLVYGTGPAVAELRAELGGLAEVVGMAEPSPAAVLADLAGRGIRRLLVEGGSQVQAAFLAADLVDELRLAIAPLLVGDPAAPRFAGATGRPRHFTLVATEQLDGVVVLHYRRAG
ncbi:MAG: deaminase [Streptosporangiales bacterium]|nr:deaminase [Streptosporangiales bacterium]